jgi:SanA protein
VPAESIVLDKSGFRTLNSIVHTNKVYGQSSVTIISQRFHNQRAVFLALCNGVDAVAYNAEDVVKWNKYLKIHGREYLARVRMFVDLIMRREKR